MSTFAIYLLYVFWNILFLKKSLPVPMSSRVFPKFSLFISCFSFQSILSWFTCRAREGVKFQCFYGYPFFTAAFIDKAILAPKHVSSTTDENLLAVNTCLWDSYSVGLCICFYVSIMVFWLLWLYSSSNVSNFVLFLNTALPIHGPFCFLVNPGTNFSSSMKMSL